MAIVLRFMSQVEKRIAVGREVSRKSQASYKEKGFGVNMENKNG